MSSFTRARVLWTGRWRDNRPVYVLQDDMTFELGYKGSGLAVTAKAGFETDLASDPTGILASTGAQQRLAPAFIVHDLLCENSLYTRLTADCMFLLALEALDCDPALRELLFLAVRTNNSRARHNPDELVFAGVEMPPY